MASVRPTPDRSSRVGLLILLLAGLALLLWLVMTLAAAAFG